MLNTLKDPWLFPGYTFVIWGSFHILREAFRYFTRAMSSGDWSPSFFLIETFVSGIFILCGIGMLKKKKLARVIAYIVSGSIFLAYLTSLANQTNRIYYFDIVSMLLVIPFLILVSSSITTRLLK